MNEKNQTTETFSRIGIALMFIGVAYLLIKGYNDRKAIEEHGKHTIGKYTFCKQTGKSNSAYIKYFVNGKPYRNSPGVCPDNYNATINKYFEVTYAVSDPNAILVDFSKEIKDSAAIRELESKLEFKYWITH